MFINAAADGWIIKGMAELPEGNGYMINFYKLDPKTGKETGEQKTITVRNGHDAEAPDISLKKDPEDGNWYWFITYKNGNWDWLTGEDGEKIRVNGKNGEDYSPKLSVVNGYWYISYKGETPHPLLGNDGKPIPAVAQDGEKGDKGEDAEPFLEGVGIFYTTPTEGYLEFKLNGNTFQIPFTFK
jgi:myo-inositol-hexaphosphate 3-phosphohydrolase